MLKFNLLLLVLISFLFLTSCSQTLENKLIGEWEGTDNKGNIASFVFNKDKSANMIFGNVVIDGKSEEFDLNWEFDDNFDPMHLDLLIKHASAQTRTIPMIVRFISDTKIQLRISYDMKSRPTEFSNYDSENQIILTKQ